MNFGTLRSVNVGRGQDAEWAGTLGRTAIDKRPVTGRTRVDVSGLDGDEQADTASHGGHDQAVYAFAREELDRWEGELGRSLRDGVFGENLTTSGIEVSHALIGERWRVGSVLLEVTLPRVPCVVFQNWLDEPGLVKRFTEEGRTGAYLRVVESGEIAPGDIILVAYRPDHGIDLGSAFRAKYDRDIDTLRRVLDIPGRSDTWQETVDHVERQLAG